MVGIRKSFYRKNTVLLQCRYSFKFSTSSMRLSAAPEFSVCTGWRWWYSMGARSCYHPAKCDRCFPPPIAERQRLPNVRIDVWHRVTTELTLRMSEGSALIMSGSYTVRVCRMAQYMGPRAAMQLVLPSRGLWRKSLVRTICISPHVKDLWRDDLKAFTELENTIDDGRMFKALTHLGKKLNL